MITLRTDLMIVASSMGKILTRLKLLVRGVVATSTVVAVIFVHAGLAQREQSRLSFLRRRAASATPSLVCSVTRSAAAMQ
jgi:hypothetical protein